jgi:hypothetical protein
VTDSDRLERALEDLGRYIDWPPARPLAATVRARIEATPARRSPWAVMLGALRRPAFVPVAAVVAACAVLIVSPGARDAVADFLGFEEVRITPESPTGRVVGGELGLGERVSSSESQSLAGFEVLVPEVLGPPDELYFDEHVADGQVALVYRARPSLPGTSHRRVGAVITQFSASFDRPVYQKSVQYDTTITEVRVNGNRGYYVDQPHQLIYVEPGGESGVHLSRLSAASLIWEQDGVLVRLESELSLQESLQIAESMS